MFDIKYINNIEKVGEFVFSNENNCKKKSIKFKMGLY